MPVLLITGRSGMMGLEIGTDLICSNGERCFRRVTFTIHTHFVSFEVTLSLGISYFFNRGDIRPRWCITILDAYFTEVLNDIDLF